MKNLLIVFSGTIMFCSCNMVDGIKGSGNIRTEKRNVDQFTGIKTSGSIDIEIKNGETQTVEVEADDNVLQYVIVSVSNGMLDVRYKPNMSFTNVHTKVYVTANNLDRVFTSGSGDIISTDTLHSDKQIEVNSNGSGGIKVFVDAPSVKAHSDGSGNILLRGRTKSFDCSSDGSGDIQCKDLLSEATNVNISGSGNAHVYASVKLKATTNGSGDVYYSGNPSSPEIHKSGSGDVEAEK